MTKPIIHVIINSPQSLHISDTIDQTIETLY